jgi:hypothetical protein
VIGAIKTVLSGFAGIRRRADHEAETAKLHPAQLIAAALVFVLLFILTLVAVVRLVTG